MGSWGCFFGVVMEVLGVCLERFIVLKRVFTGERSGFPAFFLMMSSNSGSVDWIDVFCCASYILVWCF